MYERTDPLGSAGPRPKALGGYWLAAASLPVLGVLAFLTYPLRLSSDGTRAADRPLVVLPEAQPLSSRPAASLRLERVISDGDRRQAVLVLADGSIRAFALGEAVTRTLSLVEIGENSVVLRGPGATTLKLAAAFGIASGLKDAPTSGVGEGALSAIEIARLPQEPHEAVSAAPTRGGCSDPGDCRRDR